MHYPAMYSRRGAVIQERSQVANKQWLLVGGMMDKMLFKLIGLNWRPSISINHNTKELSQLYAV
jgi:hypothetical protein